MSMFDYKPEGPWTFTSGAAITANTTVKLGTTADQVVMTGAGDIPIGWVDAAAGASGVTMTVFPLRGRVKLLFGATTAIGDYVKCGANGKVAKEATASTPTAFTIGQSAAIGADTVISDVVGK